MSFFSKLLGLGVMAGAATATVFIGKKYYENKQLEKLEQNNTIVIGSVENSAAVEKKHAVLDDIKKAASDVYCDTKTTVLQKAQNVGVNTDELTSTISEASKAIADASKVVAGKVYEKTPVVVESIKGKVEDLMGAAGAKNYVETIDENEILNEEVADIISIAEQEVK